MTDSIRKFTILVGATLFIGGCSSIKVPNVDFLKLPEFREEAENIGDYPDVANAPQRPTEMRTDAEWDEAARAIYQKRDSFDAPVEVQDALTDAQIEQKIKELGEKAEAYKADDPESMSK